MLWEYVLWEYMVQASRSSSEFSKEPHNSQLSTDSVMETAAVKPQSPGSRPFLVYMHGAEFTDQTLISFSDPIRSYRLQIPELQRKRFWAASSSGWCLFSCTSNGGEFFLWNSLMLAKIRLPSLYIEKRGLESVLFGSPQDPDFKVLLFSVNSPLITLCHVGARRWTVIDYGAEFIRCFGDQEAAEGSMRLGEPISYKGKLYFMSTKSQRRCFVIEGFDSDRVVIELMDTDDPVMPPYATSDFLEHVVEFEGEIYSVCLHFGVDDDEVIAVEVHRFDFSDMRWVKVENVPHLAFFLEHNGSFCCRASMPGTKGNSVYFFMTDDDVHLYEYDIGHGALSVHRPVIDKYKQHSSPFWIMCDKRLVNQSEEMKKGDIILTQKVQVNDRDKECQWHDMLLEEADVEKMIYCDLRPDVAESIGHYLSPVDYLQFRATCRTCRSVSPLVQFKESLLNALKSGHSLSPLLWFLEPGNLGAFIDPIHSDKYLMTLPPQLLGCATAYSKEGYLLMSGPGLNSTFFYNPFARKLLLFTHTLAEDFKTYCAGFSSNPTSDCLIITATASLGDIHVTFGKSGSHACSYYSFANDSGFSFCDNSPVFHNGAFHFLGECGFLGVLRPVRNHFAWEVHQPTKQLSRYNQKFLLEAEGKLISVFASYFQKRVRVFMWDQRTRRWVRVGSLGRYMIYVSNSSSMSMIAAIPGMGNKVYFPRLCGKSIVFYSLETKMFHTFENKDLEIDVFDTREQLRACWIDPIWR